MKSAERFLCVILSEGGEAAEVEPVGRLGEAESWAVGMLLQMGAKILFAIDEIPMLPHRAPHVR